MNTDVEVQDGDGDATSQPDEMEIHHYGGRETDLLVQLDLFTFFLENVSAALQNASTLLHLHDSI